MAFKIVEHKQKKAFNNNTTHPFQSWEWGEFRKKTGNIPLRFCEYKNSRPINSYQLMMHKIPRTKYKIGTLIKCPKPTQELIDYLKTLAKEENLIFIKIEPNYPVNNKEKTKQSIIKLLKKNNATPGKELFNPSTFWIDIDKTEDQLLESFHPKTRYNIRLAKRKGIEIVEDNSNKAFEKYIQLTRETVERQGFYAHTEKYHRLMWRGLHKKMLLRKEEPIARLFTAKYKGEIITTWILFVWHDFLYYPFGASTDKLKNVMANNLMMWEAILYGKKLGLTTFDLWGREPGKGFTRFKEGYGPKVIEFIGTWDLITNPLYQPYRIADLFRWGLLRTKTKLGLSRTTF